MPNSLRIIAILLIACHISTYAQEDKKQETKSEVADELIVESGTIISEPIDPLKPARAAFYSAVLPGLGHAYLKQYWKIPVIYAGLGIGVYFYLDNDKEYNRYRDAYKSRLAGFETDEFFGTINDDGLREAQKTLRRNKEISLLVTVGIYALNIIWANVDAHLLQYNVDENLSLKPHYKINEFDNTGNLGITVNYKF